MNRRLFLQSFGAIAVGAAAAGAVELYFAAERISVSKVEIPIGQSLLRQPIRLLHLSDFHASPVVSYGYIARAVALALESKPDLICLTGDFITSRLTSQRRYSEILKQLSAAAPTFAVLGNHDGGSWAAKGSGYSDSTAVRELLSQAAIKLLHNSATTVQIRDSEVVLIGVGDHWSNEVQPELAFSNLPEHNPRLRIVLAHNPDSKELLRSQSWELMLSGHTHGGQLVVPILGYRPFAPVEDLRFVEGLCAWENRQIYITRGVGNLHGLRFNCPPEISLLTLQPT